MTAPLEARYERLLRVYPAGYRRAHGDDMLTTMLTDAGGSRRWPRPGDAANLLYHGLRLRLVKRPRGAGLLDSGWAEACALIGPLVVLALLALQVAPRLASALQRATEEPAVGLYSAPTVAVQGIAWAAVVVAAFAGWRRVAAGLGWVALLAELVPVALLAALIATQTFAGGIDARVAGLAAAVAALVLRAPFLVVVAAAAVTTALLRLAA